MSDITNPMNVSLGTLDQVALFTIKMVKRLVKNGAGGSSQKKFLSFIGSVENHIKRLNLDRDMFFSTIRDYSRIFRQEWQGQEVVFNNMLIVTALKIGIESLWTPDRFQLFMESELSELVSWVFPDEEICFALKELDQTEVAFDYFARHSPNLEKVWMPLSDNNSFIKCCKLRNLRIIEFAGGVSDKIICNALWNTGSKKSDKILDLALTKDHKSWNLALPHLQVLKNNIFRHETINSTMRITLGAAAFAIQPKMEEVECRLEWGTYEAIVHLLDMEAKHKTGDVGNRRFNVTSLAIRYDDGNLDTADLYKVVQACPKLTALGIHNTRNIHDDISLLTGILPITSLKKLTLDTSALTDLELSVLIASACELEHLTLQMTPQSIFNYNLPKCPCSIRDIDKDEYRSMSMFPPIKTLVIEFFADINLESFRFQEMDPTMQGDTEAIIGFLSSFPTTTEIYFRNTNLLPPLVLVFGCFGGAIAVLLNLSHVSIIAFPENIPCPEPNIGLPEDMPNLSQFLEVKKLLPDLEDDVTFKHLEKLKSIEIDEIYLSSYFDNIIKALRLSGVGVSVKYRKSPKTM
ncbi:uncharacterized protein [Palaemon carinicauda]|uniref:uncharacterized protein isoform X2 n=1 Tax=Palaemon carinicauda TaxID=392227 RepID=UPI0035B5DDAA